MYISGFPDRVVYQNQSNKSKSKYFYKIRIFDTVLAMAEHDIRIVTDSNYDDVALNSHKLFVLKICNDRACSPDSLDAIEDELASEHESDVVFGLLDAHENHFTASRLLLSEQDEYIFLKQGQEIARFGPVGGKEELKKLIYSYLGF
jgi:hypothetical protein